MRTFIALAISPFIAMSAAQAQSVDFKSLSCQELAGMPPQTIELVAVWLEGHLADEEDAESMQVDFSDTLAGDLKAHCSQNPSKTVLQAADALGE